MSPEYIIMNNLAGGLMENKIKENIISIRFGFKIFLLYNKSIDYFQNDHNVMLIS